MKELDGEEDDDLELSLKWKLKIRSEFVVFKRRLI